MFIRTVLCSLAFLLVACDAGRGPGNADATIVASMRDSTPLDGYVFQNDLLVVEVDQSRSPHEILDATGREQFVDSSVVANMPKSESGKVALQLFSLDLTDLSDEPIEREFERRGLKPVSPITLAAVPIGTGIDQIHPSIRYATHWKDSSGQWCHAMFSRAHGDEPSSVDVGCGTNSRWFGRWWFAGVRK